MSTPLHECWYMNIKIIFDKSSSLLPIFYPGWKIRIYIQSDIELSSYIWKIFSSINAVEYSGFVSFGFCWDKKLSGFSVQLHFQMKVCHRFSCVKDCERVASQKTILLLFAEFYTIFKRFSGLLNMTSFFHDFLTVKNFVHQVRRIASSEDASCH